MSELLKDGINQVPGLVVMVVVVYAFLRYMEKRDAFIKELHDEHLRARNESREAIKDCTKSNRELVECITEWRSER